MKKIVIGVLCAGLLSSLATATPQNYNPVQGTKLAVNGCPGKMIPCREWCDRYVKGTDLELGCNRKCNMGPPYGTPQCVKPTRT
jgi:hypothetical protein